MADFPSIATPQYGSDNDSYLPQKSTEFEGGYRQTAKLFTRARARWTLYWNALSESDFQTLLAWFHANQGGSFTMNDPITGVSKVWQFATDKLPGKPITGGFRQVELPIMEV